MAIVTQRPIAPRNKQADDLQPDLIITDGAVTYNCWNWYKAGDTNSWKIMRATTTTDGDITTTKNEFPYGCTGYNFNPDDVADYAYAYKY